MSIPESFFSEVASKINKLYPLVHNPCEKKLNYGTAGFRTIGTLLPPVAARVIIIALLRAWWCSKNATGKSGVTVGFMITASHNPARDNGFKIIDMDGGMLTASWEPWCCRAANATTGEDLMEVVRECIKQEGVELPTNSNANGCIQIGRDTRMSGQAIATAVMDMLGCLKVNYTDHGLVTTPQLHFIVSCANSSSTRHDDILYNKELLEAFEGLMDIATEQRPVKRQVVVDASNGVGFYGLSNLVKFSKSLGSEKDVLGKFFEFSIVNAHVEEPEILNSSCGAEFAHKTRTPSTEMLEWARKNENADSPPAHYYCLDGDADRLIAFAYDSKQQKWSMIDGDRISILFALLFYKWLGKSVMDAADVGVVQTAYANDASTTHVKSELQMKVFTTATGVKHLHPVAHARDIGVYFEANGHGTVLFRPDVFDRVSANISLSGNDAQRLERTFKLLPRLLSQVCGDAIADMLMCEIAMAALQLTPSAWHSLYVDRPSLQSAVSVPNPLVITTISDETRTLTPEGLQADIDAVVSKYANGARSFVRPSGTEPIVRIYAEADTEEACQRLSEEVKELVLRYCA